MRVQLAGYNVDTAVLAEARERGVDPELLTPEPISAAYARISRYDKPVDELRRVARSEVAKARRSNERIIWQMGHHSVAEHAVFNFDVIGVSRLAIEALEHFRLGSYTEKSQRYITLDGDYAVPEEIAEAGLSAALGELVAEQSALYREIHRRLLDALTAERPEQAATKGGNRLLDGEAKEDARYVTALATEGQLGLTFNARNLELAIRRLAAHELAEVRELGRRLYDEVRQVAPSLILFVEPCPHDQQTYARLTELAARMCQAQDAPKAQAEGAPGAQQPHEGLVRRIDATADADRRLVAALLHTVGGRSYDECYDRARSLAQSEASGLVAEAMRNMELFDSVLREFEHVGCSFELVVSAACFGQLKRHRMMSLTAQPYDPCLDLTIPPAIERLGLGDRVRALADRAEELARRIAEHAPHAAPYALTNAHRRRVLVSLNARQLYHVSRLREDRHAQWDIRSIAAEMIRQAREVMPLALMLTGGKDAYPARYETLFGEPPKVLEAKPPGG